MSHGLCTSCGAAVNLTAGQSEIKCTYCDNVVTQEQAEARFNEIKASKIGGMLLIAETAMEGGGYEEALNYFNKVIEQQPDFADAWLNKGICIVRTSTYGNLKISEAISAWKAAIKFATQPEAIKKRVALEISSNVAEFSGKLDLRFLKQFDILNNLEEHINRFLLLESALAFALELNPSPEVAKISLLLIDNFILAVKGAATIKPISRDTLSSLDTTLETLRVKYTRQYPNYGERAILADRVVKVPCKTCGTDILPLTAMNNRGKCAKCAKPMSSGCFIATACYGDYNHPIVAELRQFRDDRLEKSGVGRAFVGWYYKWSPVFAARIVNSVTLKLLSRLLIVLPAVGIARAIGRDR